MSGNKNSVSYQVHYNAPISLASGFLEDKEERVAVFEYTATVQAQGLTFKIFSPNYVGETFRGSQRVRLNEQGAVRRETVSIDYCKQLLLKRNEFQDKFYASLDFWKLIWPDIHRYKELEKNEYVTADNKQLEYKGCVRQYLVEGKKFQELMNIVPSRARERISDRSYIAADKEPPHNKYMIKEIIRSPHERKLSDLIDILLPIHQVKHKVCPRHHRMPPEIPSQSMS